MNDKYEEIAQECHEANRAYCKAIGDNSQPEWADAPEWQKSSAIHGVQFYFGLLREGAVPPPSALHDSWLAEKKASGWKHGPVKNTEKKEHPCFVAYGDLPAEQKFKDFLFGAICKAHSHYGQPKEEILGPIESFYEARRRALINIIPGRITARGIK